MPLIRARWGARKRLSAAARLLGVAEARGPAIDYAQLSRYLRALSVPSRLELLRALRTPRPAADIDVRPFRRDAGRNPERSLSRQTVEAHLRKLEALGLVRTRADGPGGRAAYVLDHARLFLVVEELRQLSLIPVAGSMTASDQASAGSAGEPALEGPALVLAGGPLEGTAFPLQGQGPWVIGRAGGAAVPLLYDPFVSKENARVRREGRRYLVRDLPGSRNGTRLNWRPLPKGAEALLRPGDTIGVGRSLLLFREG